MPRGVKGTINYEAELTKIDAKISKHKDEIKKLTEKRNEVLSKKQDSDMKVLHEYMLKQGVSAEAILDIVKKSEK